MATEYVSIDLQGAATAWAALERCVASGGVAVFPSDGVYGLACDPLDATAINRIHAIKGRDEGKPSAVMYLSTRAIRELLASLGQPVREAVAALLPGPVTLVVPNPERRYPLACRGEPERLGVRMISGPLEGVAMPLFQTSANLSGEPPSATLGGVPASVRAGADLVVDGGELPGTPSTVVDLTGFDPAPAEPGAPRWRVLREGALPADEIAARIGRW